MIQLHITLPGPCRTKKTGQKIIQIKAKGGGPGFTKIVPGDAYMGWFHSIMTFKPLILEQLRADGVALPLTAPVEVTALVYRDRRTGDLLGYEEGIGDILQAEAWSKPEPGKKQKKLRDGLGIIVNDSQIVSWDGSRLRHDKDNPRVELTITTMEEGTQPGFDFGEPEAEAVEVF